MRVALLVNRVPDYARPVYEGLAERFDLSVFTYRGSVPTTLDGRSFASIAPFGYPLSTAPRALLEERYDVIVAGGLNFFPTHASAAIARLRDVPLVLGPCDEWAGSQSAPTRTLRPIKRLVLRSASSFVAPGPLHRDFLVSLGGDRQDVLLGPYTPCTVPPAAEWTRPAELSAESVENGHTILYFGRLLERKGVRSILEAFGSIDDRGPLRLVVAGDGPLADYVTARCGGMPGATALARHLSHAEKAWLMARATVTVLPAAREPWGIVVTESLSVGTPVIASTEVPAALAQIEGGTNGFLVAPRDADSLARQFESLPALAGPDASKRARESVEHLTVENQVDAFAAAIERAGRD